MSVINIEMVLEAVGVYQVTKGGVDGEEEGPEDRTLGDPHRKRK